MTGALVWRKAVPERVSGDRVQRHVRAGRDGEILKVFILLVTTAVCLYARVYLGSQAAHRRVLLLMLFAMLGMMLLVSAGNLVTVYLGLELLSL